MLAVKISLVLGAGLFAGSFVTILAERTLGGESLLTRCRCTTCANRLALFETFPLLAWVLLRGRCRHCAARISVMYLVVELTTALLWLAVMLRFGWDWRAIPPLVLVVALMSLSVVDLYSYRLPDRLVFPSLALSLLAMLASEIAGGDFRVVSTAMLGMASYFLFLLLVHLVSPKGLGFGDVKFALLLGLHLGWLAGINEGDWLSVVQLVFWTQLLASMIGLVMGISVGVVRRNRNKHALFDAQTANKRPLRFLAQSFPFGPALAIATLVVVLFA